MNQLKVYYPLSPTIVGEREFRLTALSVHEVKLNSYLKVAFLALDDIHHLHHIIPVAVALSREPNYQCIIYVQAHCASLAKKLMNQLAPFSCRIETLSPSLATKIIKRFKGGQLFSVRKLIRRHADQLLSFDALVTPDLNLDELIKKSAVLSKRPIFFATRHGAGDRNRDHSPVKEYDYVLLHGEKYRQRFEQAGWITEGEYAVTGYPKFDFGTEDIQPRLFKNDRPVVLYNPHFDHEVSSWPHWGLEILEYFYQQNAYNFIFAPHCNLFRRHSPAIIPKKYFSAPHLLLDLGSEQSVDTTYLQAADIYLGDESSQIYEFIRRPRPCLFLNPRCIRWQNNANYLCWNLGPVVADLAEISKHLSNSDFLSNPYAALQKQYFDDTFSVTDVPAGVRTAQAIAAFLRSNSLPCG